MGWPPSLENYKSGAYPFGKIIVSRAWREEESRLSSAFWQFLHSPDGIVALHEAGVLLRTE